MDKINVYTIKGTGKVYQDWQAIVDQQGKLVFRRGTGRVKLRRVLRERRDFTREVDVFIRHKKNIADFIADRLWKAGIKLKKTQTHFKK